MVENINGHRLTEMFSASLALFADKYKEVDSLNVFPVPDGDTGTNMYLTLETAVREIETTGGSGTVGIVAEAVARGALMGARGNSGVILSQLLRGMARTLKDLETVSGRVLAKAFDDGVRTAYKAIMKPVEGTILTVAREAAVEAHKAAQGSGRISDVLEAACTGAERALSKTPEMLPVLREAGVVDAGGMGWVIILRGLLQGASEDTLTAGKQPKQLVDQNIDNSFLSLKPVVIQPGGLTYPYCTEVLVRSLTGKTGDLKKVLEPLGDSLIVVDTAEFIKVHLHAANPGKVLEACLNYGPLVKIKIENMNEQVAGQESRDGALNHADESLPPEKTDAGISVGIVAVAAGAGIKQIMESLGADFVVAGGQTMNPSAEDLLTAVQRLTAPNIIILPNNKNIIMTANQVQQLTDKTISVVPTRTIPQGLAALIARPDEDEPAKITRAMSTAAAKVKTGELTQAVRDTRVNGQEILQGNILGIFDGEIVIAGEEVALVAVDLLKTLIAEGDEICTLYYGEMITAEEAEQLMAQLQENYPDVEFELYSGGQPLYHYIISVE